MEKKFIEYNKDTGLKISSKTQIMDDLLSICKTSYGADYTVEPGTEMYAFLDNLAYSLSEMTGAFKAVYDAFGFTSATGVPLDVLCSLAGISRNEGETDTQLRARYFKYLYSKSVGTVKSLETKLLEVRKVINSTTTLSIDDVKVLNNDTNTKTTIQGVDVEGNSIAVICKINSPYATIPTNLALEFSEFYTNINTVIKDYKSLGCGVTTSEVDIPEELTPSKLECYFLIAERVPVDYIAVGLYEDPDLANPLSENEKEAIRLSVKRHVREYIKSLQLGDDILYSGVVSTVYKMYEELGYSESLLKIKSVSTLTANYDGQGNITGYTSSPLSPTKDYKVNANQFVMHDNTWPDVYWSPTAPTSATSLDDEI